MHSFSSRSLNAAQGVGSEALALGGAKKDDDKNAVDENAGKALGGAFSTGAAEAAEGEDPNMLRFIENELAKRRAGAGGGGGGEEEEEEEEGRRREMTEEEKLWVTPAELSVRKMEGEETADRWLTGIVEVQLPMDYKLKNIEETELAKQKMLEKTRRGGAGNRGDRPPGMPPPPPVPKRQQQPANLSANFTLHRKMFARSFGQGRGSTTAMQEYVGAPKAQKAENVASDDYVFKRYINNERKKKPRK